MKKSLKITALSVLLSLVTHAEVVFKSYGVDYDAHPFKNIDESSLRVAELFACQHPFRKVGTNVVNLIPMFIHVEHRIAGSRPMPEWKLLQGKVIQANAGEGMLVQLDPESSTGHIVYILRNSQLNVYTDDQSIAVYALSKGIHHYTSVNGSEKTVSKYDPGEIINGDQSRALFRRFSDEKMSN